jgi:hypothetical protein
LISSTPKTLLEHAIIAHNRLLVFMVQLSWSTISPGIRNKVFMQSIVKLDMVVGIVAVLATDMDEVVMDIHGCGRG